MDEVDRVLEAAKELMDLNFYREALAILKEASTKYQDEPDIFYFMGCCALNDRAGEEAFCYFSISNELCPEDADILSGLSDASLTMDRNDLAARFISEALKLEPDSINARISFGHFLEKEERFTEAVAHYRKILTEDPENTYLNARLGYCLMSLGMFEEAADEIAAYLKECPTDTDWHFQLGICYGHMGMIDEAMTTFNYLVHVDPDDPMARAYLALAMADKGWLSEAKEEITRALRMDPENPRVLEIYEDIMGRDEDGNHSGQSGDAGKLLAMLLLIKTIVDRKKREGQRP